MNYGEQGITKITSRKCRRGGGCADDLYIYPNMKEKFTRCQLRNPNQ